MMYGTGDRFGTMQSDLCVDGEYQSSKMCYFNTHMSKFGLA